MAHPLSSWEFPGWGTAEHIEDLGADPVKIRSLDLSSVHESVLCAGVCHLPGGVRRRSPSPVPPGADPARDAGRITCRRCEVPKNESPL